MWGIGTAWCAGNSPNSFRLSDPRKRELVYRFHDKRELVGALFDHTIWDGVRMFNETLTPAIESTPFDSRWLLRDRYIPVVAEGLMSQLESSRSSRARRRAAARPRGRR